MNSPFTAVPQDVLQFEINRFLDPVSRVAWNTLLTPEERVYKKLPQDYALKVNLLAQHMKFKSLRDKAADALDVLSGGGFHPLEAFLVKTRFLFNNAQLFAFLSSPLGTPLIMYRKGFKEALITTLDSWINYPDGDYYWDEVLLDSEKEEIVTAASKAKAVIQEVQFVRHISHKRSSLGLL